MVYSDQWALGFMGDVYAIRLQEILANRQPYPGDYDYEPMDLHFPSRFFILPHEGEVYTICDHLQNFNSYLHISRVRLSSFCVGKWYTEQCARNQLAPCQWDIAHEWMIADLTCDSRMGNALGDRAREVLTIGAPYNAESSVDMLDDHFDVSPSVDSVEIYRILDRARCLSVEIERELLEDLDFNLIDWYGAELLLWDLQGLREALSNSDYEQLTNGL